MQVVHHSGGDRAVLADDASRARTTREKLQGVMFKAELPPGYGLVFPFERAKPRGVHMLFVRVPIDVIWTVDGTVRAVDTLQPWTGYATHRADRIVELPAGTASEVDTGDRVTVEA
ncbi:MAG: DUF192 domain-containing protein [Halodesulfurarchaeum sp.]